MIHSYIQKFTNLERDINTLSYVLIVFFSIQLCRSCYFIFIGQYDQLAFLFESILTIISVLIVIKGASRLIVNSNIIREDDHRRELIRTTHHLIAITRDLEQKILYLKTLLKESETSTIAITEISKSIQQRYETLYKRETFTYLPGNCVDIISNISGSIYGIGVLSTGLESTSVNNSTNKVILPDNPPIDNLDELASEVGKLIEELFTLRT